MKQILAILLFLSVSYQFAVKMGVIIWFEANRDYIASELCENRDKPQTRCDGKCYLKKQLAKIDHENSNNKELPNQKQKNEIPEYLAIESFLLAKQFYCTHLEYNSVYTNHYRFTAKESIFHPPPTC